VFYFDQRLPLPACIKRPMIIQVFLALTASSILLMAGAIALMIFR
jgi:hypothetical protein